MSIQIQDESTINILSAATGPDEVRAPDGRLLGQFIPAPTPRMSFPELGITDEEWDRRVNDPDAKWYTPDQVMARLREMVGFEISEGERVVQVTSIKRHGK